MSERTTVGPSCAPGAVHCATCADEAVSMRVLEVQEDSAGGHGALLALCEDEHGAEVEILTGLLDEVAPGDRVLVHAGTALLRLAAEQPR